jgi:hypothetical protein
MPGQKGHFLCDTVRFGLMQKFSKFVTPRPPKTIIIIILLLLLLLSIQGMTHDPF